MGINRNEKNDEKIVILITKTLKEQIYKETIRTGLSRGALIRNWIEKELKEKNEDDYFAEHQKERVTKMLSDQEGGAISFKDACEAVWFWFGIFWQTYKLENVWGEDFEKWYMFCVHELNRCRYTLTVEELREYQELIEKWRNEKNDAKKA